MAPSDLVDPALTAFLRARFAEDYETESRGERNTPLEQRAYARMQRRLSLIGTALQATWDGTEPFEVAAARAYRNHPEFRAEWASWLGG